MTLANTKVYVQGWGVCVWGRQRERERERRDRDGQKTHHECSVGNA